MINYTILYTVPCHRHWTIYTTVYYAALFYTILYYTTLYYDKLQYTMLLYTILYCTIITLQATINQEDAMRSWVEGDRVRQDQRSEEEKSHQV